MTPETLKSTRLSLGLTQVQLAKKLGVTGRAVSMWETGMRKVPKPIILLLAMLKMLDQQKEKSDNS